MSATPALLLSAGVTVILRAIAASTSRVRIQTGVCVLPVLDPLQLAEKYELLRRLWREENVTWEGRFHGPLDSVTSLPRLYAGEPRSWHGSATTVTSAALAAK